MRSRAFFALPTFVLLANFGCGRSAEERQLDSMRDEIEKVRARRDHADHAMSPLEPADPSLVVPQAYTSAAKVRPPPPVVQIGNDEQREYDDGSEGADPQDTTPRPTIRVFGSTRGSGRNARGRDDQIEQSAPDEGTEPPPPRAEGGSPSASARGRDRTSLDAEAKRAYEAALSLVNGKHFEEALDAFAAFLVRWPDHPYADNAMYWRGECYFARGDYLRASEQFDGELKRFPGGNKTPDALLKLGMSQEKLGNATRAKESFDRLADQYPQSDAARHIATAGTRTVNPRSSAAEGHR